MKKYIVAFILFLIPCMVSAQWEQTNGPYGGTPRCFATNGSNVFMGTNYNGGFYSSTNSGMSWNRIYNSLSEYDIYSLIYTGSTLLAGTQFGIYLSTNSGNNWIFSGLSNQFIWSLAVSGSNIFAGTAGSGIYLSTNNGTSWNAVNNGISNMDIRTITTLNGNIYAGTYGSGVFRSTNNGNNWSSINSGITNLTIITSINLGTNLFIGTQGNLGGVFKSTNNGNNWSLVNTGLLNTNLYTLNTSQGNLFAGTQGGGVYKSTDNGINWFYSNNGLTSSYVWSFTTSGNNLIAGCFDAGGCFISTNNGNNWNSSNTGLLNQNVTSLEVLNSNIFAGTNRDGVFKSTNNGLSWENSNNGLPNRKVYSMCISGTNIFAGIGGGGGIFKSTDNGNNWSISNIGLTNQTVLSLEKVGSNLFAGTYGGGIFKSTNDGLNWINSNVGITNNNIWNITSIGSIIISSTENGVFRSTNEGANWNASNTGLTNTYVRSLTTSGANIIAGTYGNGIFISSNGGINWSLSHAGIPYVWSFSSSGSYVFAGTQTGVFWSTNNGMVWNSYNQNFPTKIINSILATNNYVFAGTEGSSVWRQSIIGTNASVDYPTPYGKLISGNIETIRWSSSIWQFVNVKCTLNVGSSNQSILTLATNHPNTTQEFPWLIPDNTLSYRSKIVIENAANQTQKIESDIFRIKPYLLTRVDVVNNDSTYYEYRKNRDQWGFWNDSSQMFPHSWYQQFDYQGIDPFTGLQYSQWQGLLTFRKARNQNFTDWISYVNAFTINKCYWNTSTGNYKELAVLYWRSKKKKSWDGSCFGLAVSNGLVFRNKTEFLNKYPSYPNFSNPINVTSTNEVKKVINDLFTHQFGQPHLDYRSNIGYNKTPTQTLIEMKAMLLSEKDSIRALTFYKNSQRTAGHTVLPYQIKQSTNNTNIYFVYIYDNANPFSNNPIIINTSDNGGNGYWSTPDWSGWGGTKNFFLEDPVQTYFSNPTDSKFENNDNGINTVQFLNSQNYSYKIKDMAGNISGYMNDSLENNIPNSYPLIYLNASEGSPYGFQLPNSNYRVEINGFSEDTIQAAFFLNNKAFSYERYNAAPLETDKINFENGISVSNPDPNLKNISLLNIQAETTQEKVFAFSSLDLAQNDSVKIENLGSENFKLTSYGSSKKYDIELTFASQSQLGRFVNVNIALPPNSSHTFVPNWINLTTSQLVILQDSGNNGTIDDTIRVNNIITNLEEGSLILPDKYSLAQNYPNPFNPSTKIKYDIKIDGLVTLKVYNILGMEVSSLVNEVKQAGRYEVEFNGLNLNSGIYYYRLQAGEYTETKKMLLLK